MKRQTLLYVAALCTLCIGPLASAPVHAADQLGSGWQVATADSWNSLTDDQQRLLANHRERWDSYPPQRRERLLQGVRRYQSLSPEQQAEARRAHQRFARMSPEERSRLREQYLRSRRPQRR